MSNCVTPELIFITPRPGYCFFLVFADGSVKEYSFAKYASDETLAPVFTGFYNAELVAGDIIFSEAISVKGAHLFQDAPDCVFQNFTFNNCPIPPADFEEGDI